MNISSVSCLALAMAFGVTLTACSSTPPGQISSDQTAPGTSSRPILSANEAKSLVTVHHFLALTPNTVPWSPSSISLPVQPNFVVGPVGTQGVTHTSIQAAVDAAIIKRTNRRQYIAIMPGEYRGTVYIPAATGSLTLYGMDEKPPDVRIDQAIDGDMSTADWRRMVNPAGKYIPGKPAWYVFDNCQNKRDTNIGVMYSAVVWSQNNGLQLQNLTIENNLGDSADAGNHPAVTLRTDGDKVRINKVNILGHQDTSFMTNSGVQDRLENGRQPHTLVTNSYIEGDMDTVSGRSAVVLDNTGFRIVNSRTRQETYVFAPATLSNVYYGFLTINSRSTASGDGVTQLGRSLGVDSNTNSQVVIRDSVISEGLNMARPWVDSVITRRPFVGNTGAEGDKGEIQRDLNDTNSNRVWEYNSHGIDSKVVAEPKQQTSFSDVNPADSCSAGQCAGYSSGIRRNISMR